MHVEHDYSAGADRPLGSFATIAATYGALVVGLGAVVRRRGHMPERPALADWP